MQWISLVKNTQGSTRLLSYLGIFDLSMDNIGLPNVIPAGT